jgi:5-methylthioadenosine/S-adenosylhomocysteine deaminase
MDHPSRRAFLTNTVYLTAGTAVSNLFGFPSRLYGRTTEIDAPKSDRILLKGGSVLTFDPDIGDFEKADVFIEGSKIAAVGENIEIEAEKIDASEMIVMPGFVDTHRHMWQGALRNILPNGLLTDYLQHILGSIRAVYRPEDVYIGNLTSALGAINAGVTTVLDWSHIGNSPEHTDAAIEGLQESEIRGVYAFGGGVPGPRNSYPHDIRRLRKELFASDNQLLTLALAAGLDASQWKIARDVGARISVHVNGAGQLIPFADVLGTDVTCIHCTNLLEEEWQLLADTGAGVSISAPVEMIMGHGIPPIQQALEHGIQPSLSVDVETNIAGEFFTQMRSVFTLQRMQALQRRRTNEDDSPDLLTVREVLEFATGTGARHNGLDHKTGTLTPGKEADIIMLRKDMLNVIPVNDVYGAVVLSMDTGNVDTVLISGKIKKWGGELTDIDKNRINRLIDESRDYVLSKSGWKR